MLPPARARWHRWAGRLPPSRSPSRTRTWSADAGTAIAARDGGCVIPGCSVPAAWCEVHHVIEHASGGPTHTDNGVTLCWYHHRTIDTAGWAVTMRDGTPYVRAPRWVDSRGTWRQTGNPRVRKRRHDAMRT
ncbi:HNH endonuclease signature motif containing protein [Humibacter ginsenosidimutans]|uniref:HNH endonuclease n=1 Tax=Humibacter ginsenosidimutans TaxID=2599293 RepID=A0A5B8M4F4_9MICO|nr:HNH endonuclease [Humibacter ginsenosidimutans]